MLPFSKCVGCFADNPASRKWNIHFYVNRCGFHIVEYFNEKHPDPHDPEGGKGEDFDGMFRFEKVMKRV